MNSFDSALKQHWNKPMNADRHQELQTKLDQAIEAHNKVTAFVARFLVPYRTSLPESWLDGFVESGAVTIDKSYPYGFVEAVKLSKETT